MDRVVHIVVDDATVGRALEPVLEAAGFSTVTHATPRALLDAATRGVTGCILLDLRLLDMDGLAVPARLTELGLRLPVIVVTGRGDIQIALRALKAGAVDFIEAPFDAAAVLAALEAALAGPSRAPGATATAAAQRIATLSRGERNVLDRLAAGHPTKVIAGDLGISVGSVEVHRARMLERLGTSRLAEALRLAVAAGLAPPEPTRQPDAAPPPGQRRDPHRVT